MRYLGYLLLVAALGALQGCFPIIATGVGASALMASDRRTTGTYIEDEGIELKASSRVSEQYKDDVHLNVTSYNRRVLLTGEVPNGSVRAGIEQVVAGIPNVKSITNELLISGTASLTSRSSDTLITSDVKFRFLNNKKAFQADHIKVVTENGTVYLMGLVYHKEADAAADIASTTSGVQRVVKAFEYLD